MGKISEDVQKLTTAIIDKYKGIYCNPELISRGNVATALTMLTHNHNDTDDTNRAIALGPFNGAIEIISDHDEMPAKVEWAAKIHLHGLDEPLWASYTKQWGVDIDEYEHYWMSEGAN